jgi:hypothetical protein
VNIFYKFHCFENKESCQCCSTLFAELYFSFSTGDLYRITVILFWLPPRRNRKEWNLCGRNNGIEADGENPSAATAHRRHTLPLGDSGHPDTTNGEIVAIRI